MTNNSFNKGQDLYLKAKQLIPGGTQLFGKKPEMYLPDYWPAYYSKAKGCEIWDLDGKRYLDFTMVGIGTSILGYADSDVNEAAINAINNGNLTTLNAPEEVQLAEKLIEIHPWADMARFARSGGEIMSVAIRIARASSGRSKVAFCGYHGWHDWYLSANISDKSNLDNHLMPDLETKGVPSELSNLMLPFDYNNIESLEKIINNHGEDIGVIVMEPCRDNGPNPGFLENVRRIASKNNTILIFDEITSGFRAATSGMHMIYKVFPDLCAFGKTISNGIPMAALIGKKEYMKAATSTFISSTYWTDRAGPSAANVFLEKHAKLNVGQRTMEIGLRIQNGFKLAAENANLKIIISGIPPLTAFRLEVDCWPEVLTLYTQKMLSRSILANDRCYANFAHSDKYIGEFFSAVNAVFCELKSAIDDKSVKDELIGPVKIMGFKKA